MKNKTKGFVVTKKGRNIKMDIVKNGSSQFSIVVPKDANHEERYAASELAHFLALMTKANLPIIPDSEPKTGPEILIGYNSRTDSLGVSPDDTPCEEEYQILAKNGDLVLAGSKPRGTLYSVYGFLQDVLGFRFYAPDCIKIPYSSDITLEDDLSLFDKPAFRYRESNYAYLTIGTNAARARQNGAISRLSEEHGGHHTYAPGFFVHTFQSLIPSKEYYDEHPEFFALVKGKRDNSHQHQICLTNPDVLRISIEKSLDALRKNPEATLISISQSDNNDPCECEHCQKIADEEESQSGPIIHFVNAVADAIAKEFPHVMVDTLSYLYSEKPPKIVRPRDNVQIRFALLNHCHSHPLRSCKFQPHGNNGQGLYMETTFADMLRAWSKIAKHIAIWDYAVYFEFYFMMRPNFHTLADNMRFYKENNVDSIFYESNANTGGEMVELRGYILTQLMWNLDFDVQAGIAEFCHEFFGEAAPYILEYLDITRDALLESNFHMCLSDYPTSLWISADLLKKADALFDKAEQALKTDPIRLRRVQKERLAVRFAKFFYPAFVFEDRGAEADAFMADLRSHGGIVTSTYWGSRNIRQLIFRGIWRPHEDDMEVIPD
jgi:hypothetical protein